MEPKRLEDIPHDIFIQDIKELTENFSIEFPKIFKEIQEKLNISSSDLFITDFIENQKFPEQYTGYIFDKHNKKMYDYTIKNKNLTIYEVDRSLLTTDDTYSVIVLDLL